MNCVWQTLQRLLHARQLSLKLIANVTYGYTSANFSGRMPSVEVSTHVIQHNSLYDRVCLLIVGMKF